MWNILYGSKGTTSFVPQSENIRIFMVSISHFYPMLYHFVPIENLRDR